MEISKVRVLLMALRKAHRAKICETLLAEKILRQEQEIRWGFDRGIEQNIEAEVAKVIQRLTKEP